jgi:H+/Cl- antiporter ClcA
VVVMQQRQARSALTLICVGSGVPGGSFAPSMALGALRGGFFGLVGAPFGQPCRPANLQ